MEIIEQRENKGGNLEWSWKNLGTIHVYQSVLCIKLLTLVWVTCLGPEGRPDGSLQHGNHGALPWFLDSGPWRTGLPLAGKTLVTL